VYFAVVIPHTKARKHTRFYDVTLLQHTPTRRHLPLVTIRQNYVTLISRSNISYLLTDLLTYCTGLVVKQNSQHHRRTRYTLRQPETA